MSILPSQFHTRTNTNMVYWNRCEMHTYLNFHPEVEQIPKPWNNSIRQNCHNSQNTPPAFLSHHYISIYRKWNNIKRDKRHTAIMTYFLQPYKASGTSKKRSNTKIKVSTPQGVIYASYYMVCYQINPLVVWTMHVLYYFSKLRVSISIHYNCNQCKINIYLWFEIITYSMS